MDDSGFPRTPDRLLESFGTHARRSEVFGTMMGACEPLNLGGSATIWEAKRVLDALQVATAATLYVYIFCLTLPPEKQILKGELQLLLLSTWT